MFHGQGPHILCMCSKEPKLRAAFPNKKKEENIIIRNNLFIIATYTANNIIDAFKTYISISPLTNL